MFSYGDWIKTCRKMKGMSQKELASIAYIGQWQISLYENNVVVPRVDVFERILNVCGYEIGIREKLED